jgi:hypothetical protein
MLLPTSGALTVIAAASPGVRLGAVWTINHDPPSFSEPTALPCQNVHQRNPATNLYRHKGFRVMCQGCGALGLAMRLDLG